MKKRQLSQKKVKRIYIFIYATARFYLVRLSLYIDLLFCKIMNELYLVLNFTSDFLNILRIFNVAW